MSRIVIIGAILTLWTLSSLCNIIERFEHIDTKQGLSQSNVLTMYCDNKGFMWFGTMDGLNRYDGYNFKVYKSVEGKPYTLTNNRIAKIWEDSLNFLWVKTYEGYYHQLNPETENFTTYPNYLVSQEEKNSKINCFFQWSKNEIWLGSSNSGAYYLKFDSTSGQYKSKQFLSRGISGISNNNVHFITSDNNSNIWIGTKNGLNQLKPENLSNAQPDIKHLYANLHFISTVKLKKDLFFATKKGRLLKYESNHDNFDDLSDLLSEYKNIEIKNLTVFNRDKLIISTSTHGIVILNISNKKSVQFTLNGKNIRSVYLDHYNNIWITSENFGITKLNLLTNQSKHYTITPPQLQPIVDDERLFLFEDSENDLWLGTHGAGLAHYDQYKDKFDFYRNTPNLPGTLSSNFVHTIGEDKSGLLWVGTGQFNGGINKVVKASSSFRHIQPKLKIDKLSENVIRFLFEDSKGFIWMATKSGDIYIYNQNLTKHNVLNNIVIGNKILPGYNIYSICEDDKGHIWLGAKGGGVLVSKHPLSTYQNNYRNFEFNLYQNSNNDTTSLSSNFVYSIIQDNNLHIWISTYGGGVNKVINRTNNKLVCQRYNTENSGLTSNDTRYLLEDSEGNIWIGTTFGLNRISKNEKTKKNPSFDAFLFNPQNQKSISYNDVIHIYEDTKNRIWLGTFGGGLNLLQEEGNNITFKHYNTENGLINDAVFSILEDHKNFLWLSTEKGISMFNPEKETFENYDTKSGLFSESYSENTGCITQKGTLLFGSVNGTLVIHPERLEKSQYMPPLTLTNFQLSNRNVDFTQKDAPISKSIETTKKIKLKHDQSSFSIEYAALSFFSPDQNNYSFILENFDNSWNDVGNQRKATYTNIPPGKYVFKVKGSSWDGTWNDTPYTLEIQIFPPWWKSRIAYLIYFLLTSIILLVARKILLNYYKLHNDLVIERRVNDIKLQFFTNISHEIRTPLTLILGPIEDIKATKNLPPNLLERIETMERNGKRMLRLINQLLDFRKIQKSNMSLHIHETNLISFVNEIAIHFKPIARSKNITVELNAEMENLPVYIDIKKFDSVVFNILSNAFKYSPKNSKISIDIMAENAEMAQIIVSDQGPGIPNDKQNLLFQRFTTLDTGTEGFDGSGIGLNLSYEIMKLHKGNIVVESQIGKGSKFKINLPLGKEHFKPEDISENKPTEIKREILYKEEKEEDTLNEDSRILKKKKLLLVEDNIEIIMYLKNILSNSFSIKSANNGKEGLEALKEYHPDLIISDVMMPEVDGIAFTKQVKSKEETSHIPIIMLTAKSAIEDQIIGIESGAEAYILKPFNSNLLKAVVDNILTQRENILAKYSDKKYTDNINIKITPKDDEFMQSIVSIIDENYQNPEFNVEKMVELSTVSRTLLYNKLKGLTGLSPVEFIRQMRLKYAAAILLETGRGVSETAYLTGFNDIKYFRKCFKEMFGASPKEYKQNNLPQKDQNISDV